MKFKIPYWPILFGPALAFGIGFGLNALVMAVNGNQMPVLVPGGCYDQMFLLLDDHIHTCMTSATHLKFLADWIVIRKLDLVASPGDLFIWLCEKTFLYAQVVWAMLMILNYNKKLVN